MRLTKPMAAGLRFLVGEKAGQILVLFLLVMTIVFVAGVIGVDAALWHSQRRTAQKDADAAAFAGGLELFVRTDAADITTRATAATYEWGERNGIDAPIFTNSTPQVITGCWGSEPFDGKPDGVMVDLSGKGAGLFSTIWSLATPDVGAHAKVCIGSPPDATGMLPFGIPIDTSPCFDADGRPQFGEECDVEVRAPDGSSGETGTLRLFNNGSLECSASNVGDTINTFRDETAFGADTTCAVAPAGSDPAACQILWDGIGTCIWSSTGNLAKAMIEGLQTRLALEGQTGAPYNCDYLYPDSFFGGVNDSVDQWWEALTPVGVDIHTIVPGPDVFFKKRDCTSPRVVTIVLLDQFEEKGQGPYLIRGFASFFIQGCYHFDDKTDTIVAFNQRCVTKNATVPNPTGEPELNDTGHIFLQGMFINYVDIGRRGGALTEFGRVSLFLVE
jgi:hypothetical protein